MLLEVVDLEERAVRGVGLGAHAFTVSRSPERSLAGCAAPDPVAGTDLAQLRLDGRARVVVVRVRTTRREAAGLGRVDEVGRTSGDGDQSPLPDLALVALELWQRAEECLRVRVLGVVEELVTRGLLDDLACVHDHHVVRCLGHDAHVVRDEDHGHVVLLPERVEEVEDLRLDRHVERRRRLVGDQEPRAARERDRDHHALPHAAGEAMRIVVEPLGRARNPDLFEEVHCALPGLLLRDVPVREDRLRDLRPDLQGRVQRGHRVLEDHRDLVAADVLHLAFRKLRQVLAVEEHLAAHDPRRRLRDEAHDRERSDRLPATGLADNAERLPLLQREADAVDRLHDALTREEVGLEVVDLENSHGVPTRSLACADRVRRGGRRR